MIQEFTQEMKNLVEDKIRDLHTVLPGKIVSFDPARCEAIVLPHGKYMKPNGEMIDFPKISSVPVLFPQGAGQTAAIVWPVKEGDECLLLFAEQTLETWRDGTESMTNLRFDLQNAVAIVGLFAKPSPAVNEACSEDALIIEKGGERVKLAVGSITITSTGSVNVRAPVINLN